MSVEAKLPPMPPNIRLDTEAILKSLVPAHRALGELKGAATGLPNQGILINTLFLQEALASSEIENIVTTQDEVFRVGFDDTGSVEAKEVARYLDTLRLGYDTWRTNKFISENMIIDMYRMLKQRNDGYRQISGTVLRNEQTGEDIYSPPQNQQDIIGYMRDLEIFINNDSDGLDRLVKMALIHHQFESIHPFHDGNGRIGRILNVLYLTHAGLLNAPILYLSRAINHTKHDYYRLLQAVRNDGAWEEWIIYMLNAVARTATSTLHLVSKIRKEMATTKHRLRSELPKIYSQDLLNNLFRHPCTRIEYLDRELKKSRQTARSYLKQLAERGFVEEMKTGRNNYYVNRPLVDLLLDVGDND